MARVTAPVGGTTAPAPANGQLPAPPRKGPFGRVRGSLAIAVVFAVLAALFYLVAASGDSGVQVAVAAHELRAGDSLTSGAVRFVDISGSKSVLDTFLRAENLASVKELVLSHPVGSGSVLSRDDLVPAAAGTQARSMSIPVDSEHAAGGVVVEGDLVDVIDGGDTNGAPSYALTGARVLAVTRPSSGTLGSGSAKPSITVALPDGSLPDGQAALRVAAAIQHGKVEVVRSTGATPLRPGTPKG